MFKVRRATMAENSMDRAFSHHQTYTIDGDNFAIFGLKGKPGHANAEWLWPHYLSPDGKSYINPNKRLFTDDPNDVSLLIETAFLLDPHQPGWWAKVLEKANRKVLDPEHIDELKELDKSLSKVPKPGGREARSRAGIKAVLLAHLFDITQASSRRTPL